MTDEEFEAADAEYDALPGTPPDGYSFIPASELQADRNAYVSRMDAWMADGMTYARVTVSDNPAGWWLEVWREQPRKEAPHNPPVTCVQA